jgi:hypothetical protein
MNINGKEFDEAKVVSLRASWHRERGAFIQLTFEDGTRLEMATRDPVEAEEIRKACWPLAKAVEQHPSNMPEGQ